MSELQAKTRARRKIRHRGRTSQIPIYLGKQFRFFLYQSDWKVLPMAAVIAALVVWAAASGAISYRLNKRFNQWVEDQRRRRDEEP